MYDPVLYCLRIRSMGCGVFFPILSPFLPVLPVLKLVFLTDRRSQGRSSGKQMSMT